MLDVLLRRWGGEPIPNCPGRYVLRGAAPELPPAAIVGGDTPTREFRVAAARDPVIVAALPEAGLISYRRANGTYLHTLNTHEGFARKLAQLGIALTLLLAIARPLESRPRAPVDRHLAPRCVGQAAPGVDREYVDAEVRFASPSTRSAGI